MTTTRTCANCAVFYPDPKRANGKPECWNGLGEIDPGCSCSEHMTKQEERDQIALIEELREEGGIALIVKSTPAMRITKALLDRLRTGCAL